MQTRKLAFAFLVALLVGCASSRDERNGDPSNGQAPSNRFGGAGSISSGSVTTGR